MADILTAVGILFFISIWLGFFSFCLLYHVLADWRATEMGKHMMAFMLVCLTILTYVGVSLFIPIPMEVRLWVRLVLYTSLAVVVWWRVRIMVRIQLAARKQLSEL